MAVFQYCNSRFMGALLLLVSAISFVFGKPSTIFTLWDPQQRYLTPYIVATLALFLIFCTAKKEIVTRRRNLRMLQDKCKRELIFGYSALIAVALGTQVTMWKWNYHAMGTYSLFILSNAVVATFFICCICDKMFDCVFAYQNQILIPSYAYFSTLFIFSYIAPGDFWLYNFYYNAIIAVSFVELLEVLNNRVRVLDSSRPHCLVKNKSDTESDEDWEKVEHKGKTTTIFQKSIPCVLF